MLLFSFLFFFPPVPGWFRTWKRECFSITAEHLLVWQPEWGGEYDRQSLPPAGEKAQDPQKEMKCSQMAARRKRSSFLWLLWVVTSAAVGRRHGARQETQSNWMAEAEEWSLPGKLHCHHCLQCSLFLLCFPPNWECSVVSCLKSGESHWVTDGNCLICFGFFSLLGRLTLWRGMGHKDSCCSAEHKDIICFWLPYKLEKKLLQWTLSGFIICGACIKREKNPTELSFFWLLAGKSKHFNQRVKCKYRAKMGFILNFSDCSCTSNLKVLSVVFTLLWDYFLAVPMAEFNSCLRLFFSSFVSFNIAQVLWEFMPSPAVLKDACCKA